MRVTTASISVVCASVRPGIVIACAKIVGFTTTIYDIVRNVVIPATTSVLRSVPWSSNPKYVASRSPRPIMDGTMDSVRLSVFFRFDRRPTFEKVRGAHQRIEFDARLGEGLACALLAVDDDEHALDS